MLSFFRALDDLVARRFIPHRPALRLWLTSITHLGGIYTISIVGLCSIALFAVTGLYEFALGAPVALGGAMILTVLLKRIFKRARPTEPLLTLDGHALPSGHAAASLALYGYLNYVLMRLSPSPLSFCITTFVAILIIAIGFSRIYLRVHHTSDVMLGYLIGAVFLALAIALF